jgi:hypothetical protein
VTYGRFCSESEARAGKLLAKYNGEIGVIELYSAAFKKDCE